MSHGVNPGIKLVVFDWAGTLIDHGCIAEVSALQRVFQAAGLSLSKGQARRALGGPERELIASLLRTPALLRAFALARGREPDARDVAALHAAYLPALLDAIRERQALIDGALTSVGFLREQHIAIATTSSHGQAASDLVLACARAQGLGPDFAICADEVPAGSPAPCMIQACMQALQVQHARQVLVVGDTPLDVLAARNGGCFSTGVAGTGHEVGLTRDAWDELTLPCKSAALAHAHRSLRDAGADFVIDTLNELPLVIRRIAERGIHSAA
ncbi:MAG: phosphonoacetaldehyde hydrolase [Polyangiales bacterium]